MTKASAVLEGVVLLSSFAIAGALFWMSLFLIGPFALIPGAGVLFIALAWPRRRLISAQLFVEHTAFACLIAAQGALLSAVIMTVLPTLAHHLA